jgi:hypothetical protein
MNMKSFFSLIFCVLFASFAAEGQGWERVYPTISNEFQSSVKKILLNPAGGYLLLVNHEDWDLGYYNFHIVGLSEEGDISWIKEFDTPFAIKMVDFIQTSDGGYAVLYNRSSFGSVLMRLNADFEPTSSVEFNTLYPNVKVYGKQIIENNEGFWIVGKDDPSPSSLGMVAGVDDSSNPLGLSLLNYDDIYNSGVILANDGGFLTANDGNKDAIGTSRIFVRRYSSSGMDVIWEKELNGGGNWIGFGDITVAPDGGYVIAGTQGSGSEVTLIKIDEQGNIVWQKSFSQQPGQPAILGSCKITPCVDGNSYWAILNTANSGASIVLMKFDLQGNNLLTKYFGGTNDNEFALTVSGTNDGGCVIGATSTGLNRWLPFIIKTDSLGNTFSSAVAGTVAFDIDNNCIADTISLLPKIPVSVLQNGQIVAAANVGPDGEYLIGLDSGTYQISVQLPSAAWVICDPDTLNISVNNGDTLTSVDFVLQYNPQPLDSIFGYAFHDLDGDCLRDSFETAGYEGWPVYLYIYGNGAVIVADTVLTGPNGYYVFDELTGATNEMYANLIIPGPPLGSGLLCHFVNCPQEEVFGFPSGLSHQSNIAFTCDSLPPCPLIEVDIATNVIRPCSTSVYHVNYCNIGIEPASDAYIEVTFDAGLDVTASSIPWSSVNGNTYTFNLGYLTSGQCGNFDITVLASCDDPNGTTYCAEAHAFPDTCSLEPGPNWDGSQIEVTAECTGDSVIFTIQNVGIGNMLNPLEYIVIEDNVLLMQGNFELEAGEQTQIAYAANGSFFHLAAGQAPGFPGLNLPVAWVEGCGNSGNASLGFVNQYALGDEDVWLDVFCLESVNSYDPNDKNGFPRGYADEHFIEQNVDIEYLIRFQNTGTAPAYQVEIRDTLPVEWLDPATVRPGASSHDYVWDMQGNGVVVFKFPGIVLPDSAANFDASQGFVKFRVSQREDVPLGRQIENSAAIFFDFNPPIITNQTLHTVGKNFILTKTDVPRIPNLQVKIVPNPAREQVRVQIAGLENGDENLTFALYSAVGQPVLNGKFAGSNFEFQAGQLPEGVYFYEIRQEGKLAATGKLIRL